MVVSHGATDFFKLDGAGVVGNFFPNGGRSCFPRQTATSEGRF